MSKEIKPEVKVKTWEEEMKEQREEMTTFQKVVDYFEYCGIGLFIWRILDNIKMAPRNVKWFMQRTFRGYADCDLWDLNNYLGQLIIKCLKAFNAINKSGIPCSYTVKKEGGKIINVSDKVAEKNRKKDVEDMIEGFSFLTDDSDMSFYSSLLKKYPGEQNSKKRCSEYNKAVKNAQEKATKFIQHFGELWD